MKGGDLVRVDQTCKEYVDVLGKTPGIIIEVGRPDEEEQHEIARVCWPNGEMEDFYFDELEKIV